MGRETGYVTVAVLALCAASCGGGGDDHGGEGPTSGATCPQGSALTYESFGRAFMGQYCTSCHSSALPASARQGAPSDHDFDTIEGIRALEAEYPGHIDETAAAGEAGINASMPPAGSPKPTAEERRQLGEWLACGMP
ncbi:MAG TPA: hypothetical protein VFS43_24340 [Polyangiaceae bacterium]|nr:hypothetical protein [Polyangiaceae bacterium]